MSFNAHGGILSGSGVLLTLTFSSVALEKVKVNKATGPDNIPHLSR